MKTFVQDIPLWMADMKNEKHTNQPSEHPKLMPFEPYNDYENMKNPLDDKIDLLSWDKVQRFLILEN